MKKRYYITTAIDYANGKPHFGHAYEKVLADVIARYKKLMGHEVYFLTGLDEHGQKVQQTAKGRGLEPIGHCDEMAKLFKELLVKLDIGNDDYIRTTEERHKEVVRKVLQDLYDRGEIYKGKYSGFYSVKEEQFLQEKDRKEDGSWPERFGEVVEFTEENYYFKLSRHREWLMEYIEKHPEFIYPRFRANQVMEFLKEGINDLCISRPVERLSWGIGLPFDEGYVTYVWFDALLNYVSGVKYGSEEFGGYWPVDYHVIGKDILLPAHAVYWPIMLRAMGLEMPRGILAHGWWQVGGSKMSKSFGNVVDPMEIVGQYGADAVRYFFMREMAVGQDSDYTEELFRQRYESELANDLGNLVSRVLNMVERYSGGVVPEVGKKEEVEEELMKGWANAREEAMKGYEGMQFHMGLDRVMGFIRSINRYLEMRAPWKLAKTGEAADAEKVRTCLGLAVEGLRLGVNLLSPVMPRMSERIMGLIGGELERNWNGGGLEWGEGLRGKRVGEKVVLFPKIEMGSEVKG